MWRVASFESPSRGLMLECNITLRTIVSANGGVA